MHNPNASARFSNCIQDAGLALAYGDYVAVPPQQRVAALSGLAVLALTGSKIRELLGRHAEEWPAAAPAQPPAPPAQPVHHFACTHLDSDPRVSQTTSDWQCSPGPAVDILVCTALITLHLHVCTGGPTGSPPGGWPGKWGSCCGRTAASCGCNSTTAAACCIVWCGAADALLKVCLQMTSLTCQICAAAARTVCSCAGPVTDWLRWRHGTRLGLRRALGWDYHRRRYWAFGSAAAAWRLYVETENGMSWGWYDGEGFAQQHRRMQPVSW